MKLEQFIIDNRVELFDVAANANHASIMAAKLRKRKRLRTVRLWSVVASAAAAVMAIALFSINPSAQVEEPSLELNSEAMTELAELNQYHNIQCQEAIDTIKELLTTRNFAIKEEIMAQVAAIELDSKADPLPNMLLTIDTEKYLALTVQRHQIEHENLQTLINILNQ